MLKKSLIAIVAAVMILLAARPAGELVGARKTKKNFRENNPHGMAYIKRGSFMMGANDQSVLGALSDKSINVSVDAFWMDETEITNNEYRQFVNWVKDSLAMRALILGGTVGYEKLTTYKNRDYPLDELTYEELERVPLNWKAQVPWKSTDDSVQSALSFLFYDDANSLGGRKLLNASKLRYKYEWINYEQASMRLNKFDVNRGAFPPNATVRVDTSYVDEYGAIVNQTITRPLRDRKDLISEKMVVVYPDTMVWLRDLQYSYNDPKMKMYFTHISYDDYPVIGVTWEQATAFCHWRTKLLVPFNKQGFQDYRLPTEAEWEYAARGGRDMGLYPWGSNYVRDKYGCYLANLKPRRGDYTEDTGATTMKVGSFAPNNFGLYDMAGNVAEWTNTAYINTANTLVLDMNPNYQYNAKADDPDVLKRKVVKGGAWKDIAYYLQCGSRTYEYQYESRPYIGFRCVRSYNGE